jgi:hypothetical protein
MKLLKRIEFEPVENNVEQGVTIPFPASYINGNVVLLFVSDASRSALKSLDYQPDCDIGPTTKWKIKSF